MRAVSTDELRAVLRNVKPAVPQPTWDLVVYARFLAGRLPETGAVAAPDFARLAEDLLGELKEGVDRQSGAVFEPLLVSGRSDLVYNHFRAKLGAIAEKVGGSEYAAAVTAELKPVLPPAKPQAAEPAAPKAVEPKAGAAPAKDAPAPA